MMLFIGIDWSRTCHEVEALDEAGSTIFQTQVTHDAAALDELAAKIAAIESDPARVCIGVEMHDGALVAWLLDQGYTVYGINPKSADRARDRHNAVGAKDDRLDAHVLADFVRTDRHRLRPLSPTAAETEALRAWVRLRAARVAERTAVLQRLRALLADWAPALSALLDDLKRQWQRDLLRTFPDPLAFHEASPQRLTGFIRRHRLSSATRTRIRAAAATPPMPIPAPRRPALEAEIRFAIESVDRLLEAVQQAEIELERILATHPDAAPFRSLPVKGIPTVASLVAAFAKAPDGAHWRELAARWGVAPVTIQSGRSRRVRRRRACQHDICQALLFFALNTSSRKGCWAAQYYQDARERGVPHYTALRCLASRWVKILHRLHRTGEDYDESVHQTARHHHLSQAA